MESRGKKKFRVFADLYAIGGAELACPGRAVSDLERYSLWLLRRRLWTQRAAGFADALRAVDPKQSVPRHWFDAVNDWPEEAEQERYAVNADRSEARVKRQATKRYG